MQKQGGMMEDTSQLVTQFEAYLLTEKRVAQNTFLAYKRDVAQLCSFLHKKKVALGQCTKAHLKMYLKAFKDEGLSAKSIARKISTLKLLFEFLHEHYKIPNAAQSLIFPKLEKTLPPYLSEQEVQSLLQAANKDNSLKGIRNKVMLYVMYASGMRVSELVALKIDQIHFDTGFIHLVGKGNKERMVPLPKNILELLRFYLDHAYVKLFPEKLISQAKKQNYLFIAVYQNQVKPLSRQSFWMILKKILQHVAIFKQVSPHSLRHSLATHLLKNGADIRSIQILLGHENLATVQVYTHLENSELRKVYDKKHPRA